MNTRWLRVGAIAIAAAVFAAAIALFFQLLPKGLGRVAEVFIDNALVGELALSEDGEFEVGGVLFEVSGGGARFIRSSCADHRCERFGWLGESGARAVCLPRRCVLRVKWASSSNFSKSNN